MRVHPSLHTLQVQVHCACIGARTLARTHLRTRTRTRTRRSVSMDSWSADQLKKMQAGGNNKLNSFLKGYGIEKQQDIVAKYNSEAAGVRDHACARSQPSHSGVRCHCV